MKASVRILYLAVVAICLPLSLELRAEQAAPAKAPAKKATLWMAADIKWMDVPEIKGARRATLWGNPDKGAHGAFDRFAGGTEIPLHTHTNDVRFVVVSGVLVIAIEGQGPKELGSGSYGFLPGGSKHTTTCKAGADCIVLHQQPGPFDSKPVEAAGTKK